MKYCSLYPLLRHRDQLIHLSPFRNIYILRIIFVRILVQKGMKHSCHQSLNAPQHSIPPQNPQTTKYLKLNTDNGLTKYVGFFTFRNDISKHGKGNSKSKTKQLLSFRIAWTRNHLILKAHPQFGT